MSLRRLPPVFCFLVLSTGTLAAADPPKHPLDPAIELGRAMEQHIINDISDYTCKLTKIDRIDGELRAQEEIQIKVRIPKEKDGSVVQKFSIYLEYISPSKLKGRKILYVEGENDGKMCVKVGGFAPGFLHVKDYPDSVRVLSESRYPVTDLGFQHLGKTLLDREERSREGDPDGHNTEVTITRDVPVGDRPTTRVRVVRLKRQGDLNHIDELYIDDEWQIPIRLIAYDWPATPGAKPPLLESYTYSDVRLNVGLPDSDFTRDAVK
jgi:hypothetical protein